MVTVWSNAKSCFCDLQTLKIECPRHVCSAQTNRHTTKTLGQPELLLDLEIFGVKKRQGILCSDCTDLRALDKLELNGRMIIVTP